MTIEERKQTLFSLGAAAEDIDALLSYTENAFKAVAQVEDDTLMLLNFPGILEKANNLCETPPRYELFESGAGKIPVLSTDSVSDFEIMVRDIVFGGKEVPHLSSMGASFAHGKTLRFIILSNKPYSGIPASVMGLEAADWNEKSLTIRKYHECAHYYTKRLYGSSVNNLHDELIADFCGFYAAFGEYRAEWFNLSWEKRSAIYTAGLSPEAAQVVNTLAEKKAREVERWTKTKAFAEMTETERITHLVLNELLQEVYSES